jgi:hypothetical protein
VFGWPLTKTACSEFRNRWFYCIFIQFLDCLGWHPQILDFRLDEIQNTTVGKWNLFQGYWSQAPAHSLTVQHMCPEQTGVMPELSLAFAGWQTWLRQHSFMTKQQDSGTVVANTQCSMSYKVKSLFLDWTVGTDNKSIRSITSSGS